MRFPILALIAFLLLVGQAEAHNVSVLPYGVDALTDDTPPPTPTVDEEPGTLIDVSADLERVAGYFGQRAVAHDDGTIRVYHDQAKIAAADARALGELSEPAKKIVGRKIWVGDWFMGEGPGRRCYVIAHEYGHLLGLLHEAYAIDPAGVMISDNLPEVCAALEPDRYATLANTPTIGQPDPTAVAMAARATADALNDEKLTRIYELRQKRERCLDRAFFKRTSKKRQKARKACWTSYSRAYRIATR